MQFVKNAATSAWDSATRTDSARLAYKDGGLKSEENFPTQLARYGLNQTYWSQLLSMVRPLIRSAARSATKDLKYKYTVQKVSAFAFVLGVIIFAVGLINFTRSTSRSGQDYVEWVVMIVIGGILSTIAIVGLCWGVSGTKNLQESWAMAAQEALQQRFSQLPTPPMPIRMHFDLSNLTECCIVFTAEGVLANAEKQIQGVAHHAVDVGADQAHERLLQINSRSTSYQSNGSAISNTSYQSNGSAMTQASPISSYTQISISPEPEAAEVVMCCGINATGKKFCYECGKKIQTKLKCPQCAVEFPLKYKFCAECGCSLTAAPQSATANAPQFVTTDASVPSQATQSGATVSF
jgi:hypothetical protein